MLRTRNIILASACLSVCPVALFWGHDEKEDLERYGVLVHRIVSKADYCCARCTRDLVVVYHAAVLYCPMLYSEGVSVQLDSKTLQVLRVSKPARKATSTSSNKAVHGGLTSMTQQSRHSWSVTLRLDTTTVRMLF